MIINQQPQIIHNRIRTNNPNFKGASLERAFYSFPKDKLLLSEAANINKSTLDWFNKTFRKSDNKAIQEAYDSCLNSDNNIFEPAINLIKKYTPQKIKQGIFRSVKQDTNSLMAKFGLKFFSLMLQASRNNEGNHTETNINFLDNILSGHQSEEAKSYFDILVASKDEDGNIISYATKFFDAFKKVNKTNNYVDFIKELTKFSKVQQDFIVKYYDKVKKSSGLFDIIKLSEGKDSDKIIASANKDLKIANYDTDKLKIYVSNSYDATGKANFDNYEKIKKIISESSKLIDYIKYLKDKAGIISNKNVEFAKFLTSLLNEAESIKSYLKFAKDNNGVVKDDVTYHLEDVLKNSSAPENHNDIKYCIEELKNKKNEIQWDYVNVFAALKKYLDNKPNAVKYKIFEQILSLSKDNSGNIINEIAVKFPDLLKQKLSYYIPNIIRISKNGEGLNENNYKKTVDIITKTADDDRFDMSEFLLTCLDKNGDLDDNKIGILNEIQKRGIKSSIIKIAASLKNPDNTISQRGLDLAEELRKNDHHQIEKDLPAIIKLCRDKKGFLNDKNISAVKSLQKLKQSNIDLSERMKLVLNYNREVDDNKFILVKKILKELNVKNSATINNLIDNAKDKNGVVDLKFLELLINIEKKGKSIHDIKDFLPAYRILYKYEKVTDISQLNLRQKRTLMKALKRYKDDIMSSDFQKTLNSKIFPKTESEYCSLLGKLSHYLGIRVRPLSKIIKDNFYRALSNLSNEKLTFMNLDFDKYTPVLELSYPLEDFKNDVWNIVKKSHYSEKTKSLDYFGFELKDNMGRLELNGFPNVNNPDGKLSSIKDENVRALIKKLTPLVIKFTQNNDIKVKDHSRLSKDLTDIVRAFPEFLTEVGKVQHGTHDFTLDIHSLKVLQEVMKNPEFEKLSDSSKVHIQLCALLHDLTKAEKIPDSEHPANSAFDVYYLLGKLGFKEKDKLKIYNIIRKHDWLTHFDFSQDSAKRMAFNMRSTDSFKLLSMLTEADLKGVHKYNRFYLKHAAKLDKAKKQVAPYVHDIKRTSIHLPQTKIPKVRELNTHSPYVRVINKDGIKNTVIQIANGIDLGKVGFKTCKSLNDLNILVHGLDAKDSASMFQALGMISSHALLSTSYINFSKGNYRVFRQEGFVLDVADTNIHVAYWTDFGSGYKKTVNDLLNTYLFRNHSMRDYISDSLKKELHINDDEFMKLFDKIEDMPIEELDVKYPKVAIAFRNIIDDMYARKGYRSFGRSYNEILVTSPKIQAIFCYDRQPEQISSYLRRFAERNNIPIIAFN